MPRIAGLVVACSLLVGCVALPHPVTPNITVNSQLEVLENIPLSPDTDDMAKDFSERVVDSNENIEIVDINRLGDLAFSDGAWNLATLLQPVTRQRLLQELGLRYVVILGDLQVSHETDEDSFYIPFVVGAVSGENVSSLSAIIIDVEAGKAVCRIDSVARSTQRLFIYVIVAAGNMPLTRSSAIKGLANEAAKLIDDMETSETVRIAVMTAHVLAISGHSAYRQFRPRRE